MASRSLLLFRHSPIAYPLQLVWRAAISRVVDGDTLWVERDSGCQDTGLIELRLTGRDWKGFNADERFTDNGKLATARVQLLCPEGRIVRIETQPDTEKYGRWTSPVLMLVNDLPEKLIHADDTYSIDGRTYLDLAAHLVRNIPGCVWKEY
jgi:endonuclease YncB( thermonuclease family)